MSSSAPARFPRRFGLNYVPSRLWYYSWNDWDADSIARDFDALADLGIDHLRVQLIWPWFQPNPNYVSELHLERLRVLLDLARARGLDILLCPLTGFLSGYRFLPPNVTPADVFTSPAVIAQERAFFSALLPVVHAAPNWMGFDLGNEINVLALQLPTAQGDAWGRDLVSWLRPRMAGLILVNGVDHNPWFNGRTFSLAHLAADYDAVTLHAWPKFTGCLEQGGLADAPSVHLAAFMARLARHALGGAARPVWLQEFGCSPLWGSPAEQERYLRDTVAHALAAGADWFTWWCSHDVDTRFAFDPLEYSLGLLDLENRPKPLAHVFRAVIAEHRAAAPAPVAVATPAADALFPAGFQPRVHRELPESQWLEQSLVSTTWDIYREHLAGLARA